MRDVPVRSVGSACVHEGDARALRACTTLAAVLAWGRTRTPPRAPSEIVTQDEYTHDVVIPLDAERWLVFDTT